MWPICWRPFQLHVRTGKSLVVSTATVSLQEQLLHKRYSEVLTHSGLNFRLVLPRGVAAISVGSHLNRLMPAMTPTTQIWRLGKIFPGLATDKESAGSNDASRKWKSGAGMAIVTTGLAQFPMMHGEKSQRNITVVPDVMRIL